MKKNTKVNISQHTFQIQQEAKKILQKYRNRLRKKLGNTVEASDTLSEIETRMVEHFIDSNKEVLDVKEVNKVISKM